MSKNQPISANPRFTNKGNFLVYLHVLKIPFTLLVLSNSSPERAQIDMAKINIDLYKPDFHAYYEPANLAS